MPDKSQTTRWRIRQVNIGRWEYGYRRFFIRGFANTEPEARHILAEQMKQRAGWLVIAAGIMIGTALVLFAAISWRAFHG